jgi:hypothetical protein
MFSGTAGADEAKCVNTVNKNAAKVAKAQGKDNAKCIKDGGGGKLTGTIEACITSDAKGKVGKAADKLNDKVGKDCAGIVPTIPPIDVSDPNALSQIMIDQELAVIHAIFGTDLDAAGLIVKKVDDKLGWKCQSAIAKAAGKCQDAKLAAYNSCKKVQLKAGVHNAGQLQYACMGTNGPPNHGIPDGKGKIAKKCGNGLGGTLGKKCLGLDTDAFFPPCAGQNLVTCLDQKIECEVCLALNAVDALSRDCDLFDDGLANFSCGLGPSAECEVLNAAECFLPFPSTHFLVEADTPTGFRVNLPQAGLPSVSGPALLPDPYNELDGFSPMVQILMHFPQGVDPELSNASRLLEAGCCGQPAGPPWIDTRTYTGRSLDPNSPTVLLNADTGERVLHFIEPDAHAVDPNTGVADLARQTTIMRPGLSLIPGNRYIVAMRNLKDPNGNDVVAEPAFEVLRDQVSTTSPAIEDRRQYCEENIFPQLAAAGIAREDLVLAFDFVTQSEHQLTHQMLSMRDQGLAYVDALAADPNAINFSVTNVDQYDCDDPNDIGGIYRIWRDVSGTFQSPLFLDGPVVETGVQFMNVDANDTPVQNGFTNPNFDISIPCSILLDPNDPNTSVSRPLLLGHGVWLTGWWIERFIPSRTTSAWIPDWDYIGGATDWRGWSNVEQLWAAAQIIGLGSSQLNNFPAWPDRTRQGMLNTLVLGRMMKLGLFNRAPNGVFETPDGRGVFPGPSEEMFYYGISQGGIMGTFLAALTPDVERFGLDVPTINDSCSVQRGINFGPFEALLAGIGLTDPMQNLLVLGLDQELRVSAEPAGYARHVTSDPLPGSGSPSRILVTAAWLDKQVSNQCSEIAARTLGLSTLSDGSIWQGLQGIPDEPGPLDSAFVMYDSGSFDLFDPNHQGKDADGLFLIPPLANLIPSPVCDPHAAKVRTPAAILQHVNFLQPGGQVENFCSGLCDAGDASEVDSRGVCDPLNPPE